MPRLSISLLGSFSVTLDGRPVTSFESAKVRALLAYLVVERDRPHRRQALSGLLWPDRPESAARTNLRRALANLRTAIDDRETTPPALLITRETIQFNADSDHRLDVAEFGASLDVGQTGADAVQRLEKAIALYRGDFLAGLALSDCSPFETWMLTVQERLRRQLSSAFEQLIAAYERGGDDERACEHAWRWVEREPWQETAHRRLMYLLARRGKRSAALAQYRTCCRVLAKELDVKPTEETRRLYERIRDGEMLARHRRGIGNLPAPLTRVIGREAELDQLDRLLLDPACRLLTLVGLGGVGKTCLALEVARRGADRFGDGVFLVALSSLDSIESVVLAIAEAIGFSLFTAEESGAGLKQQLTPKQQLTDHLQEKAVLLVLDGFEHLGRDSAMWMAALLQAAPRAKILVTSRTRLGVQGEHVYPLGGLDCASFVGDVGAPAAVELFLASAQRAWPGFALTPGNQADVARVCSAVEGLPLAILLAAAWVPVLTPAEIAAQIAGHIPGQGLDFLATDLNDLPERHTSVRAVFDHSWRLLSEREQEIFQALSVFGGFTWHAAEYVTGAALQDLMALVRHSLLRRSPSDSAAGGETTGGRFEMHGLLRQYAAARLAQFAEEHKRVRDRHSEYYVALYGRWVESLDQPGQGKGLSEMEVETENVRAAWEWVVACGQTALLERATDRLIEYMASEMEDRVE
jgi:DNA-binding SARP family transcriptional activator/predicted ATPase